MRAFVFPLALIACGGARQEITASDLVVAPVSSAPTTSVTVNPTASATAFMPVAPTPTDRHTLSLRMRDALAASASSQTTGPDLAVYQEAIDFERANDLAAARKAYFELITKSPTSPLVPYAYLAFGDLFLAEAQDSPDRYALAVAAYEKVSSYPPPANQAFGYAQYRMAMCDMLTGNAPRALSRAKKALDAAHAYPSSPLAAEIADVAREAMVDAFALAGQPDRAPAFFRASDAQGASAMVVTLGEVYARKGAGADLASLYRTALAGPVDDALCRGARAASQAMSKIAPADLAAFEAKRSAACGP